MTMAIKIIIAERRAEVIGEFPSLIKSVNKPAPIDKTTTICKAVIIR